ncbi:unnamed protein product [Oncorhynchus mykiss]|uniref:Ig-like domain-containing protein n=1 Tax=Oncorhynchus mykiss TaxID=8022 RepID=A0A060WKF0_ONCMY|nr:unnamed protein product [Oncorhynchus mykiss]
MYAVVFLLFFRIELILGYDENTRTCPSPCTCFGDLLDCSRLKRRGIPENLPEWTVQLDLSHNKLQSLDSTVFRKLRYLSEIKLNNNEFETVPDLGPHAANITTLILANNRITKISLEQLRPLQRLETLDLSNNSIVDIKADSFPALPLKNLAVGVDHKLYYDRSLNGCVTSLTSSWLLLDELDSVSASLLDLILLRSGCGPTCRELNRNRVRRVEGLTFHGLHALRSLKIQRNGISRLMDGAFWGLSNMEVLQLDYNNLTEVSKGWLYGLLTLQQLHLGHNAISRIRPDAWEFCQKLSELDISSNHLTRLEESSFVGLSLLDELHIGNNRVSFIADGAFRGLSHLQMLYSLVPLLQLPYGLGRGEGREPLTHCSLKPAAPMHRQQRDTYRTYPGFGLRVAIAEDLNTTIAELDTKIESIIRTVASHGQSIVDLEKASEFNAGRIGELEKLCTSLQDSVQRLSVKVVDLEGRSRRNNLCVVGLAEGVEAGSHPTDFFTKQLKDAMGSDVLASDPQLDRAHRSLVPVPGQGQRPRPVIICCHSFKTKDLILREAQMRGNLRLSPVQVRVPCHCKVRAHLKALSSDIIFLQETHLKNNSHSRLKCRLVGQVYHSNFSAKTRGTAILVRKGIPFLHKTTIADKEGRYVIVIGEIHSTSVTLLNIYGPNIDNPSFFQRIIHKKDKDDVFFIVDVKTEDIGLYSCTAQNTAGAISANATLTVLETPSFLRPLMDRTVAKGETAVLQCIAGGSPSPRLNWTKDDNPLVVTERHFFAAGNQLLIIVDAAEDDAGMYTCEMSNTLGTQRGNVRLAVLPNPNCDVGVGASGGVGSDEDGWTTVGIVIIAVVCCVVGTSLVWVVIIYHTRRRNEDCSVTNTDETNLPADIPSYLSSQGTLADRQDGYIPSESGSGNHQFMASSMSGFYMQPKDMNGLCQLDTGSEADMEAAIDPLLCHYQGPISSLLRRGNMYTGEPSEAFTGCAMDQRPICIDSYSGSLTSSKRRDYYPCGGALQDPFDHGSPSVLMQMPNSSSFHGPPHLQGEGPPSMDEGDGSEYGRPRETRLSSSNTFMAPLCTYLYIIKHHNMCCYVH